MKWYLSGPMSGLPQFNFPAFDAAATNLREAGYEIVSPHELDSEAVQKAAWASDTGDVSELPPGETWGALLARDVKIIADEVDGIILLPGWTKSRGARLEVVTGLLAGKVFGFYVGQGKYLPVSNTYVASMVKLP